MASEKELVMEYEFRQFGEPMNGTDRAYWLYRVGSKSSPLGLVEYGFSGWHVIEWAPRDGTHEQPVATLPGDMSVDEALGVAKVLLLSLKESR